ncbi:hypothetical protein BD289DRAFT_434209 [Coniella lustricola]|uniref:Uncharacterized protein n=1 Tax=Coniella lustricola TaxID=2025994 RepID=A0A2T3A808_9PEZI|nr:hypothetical protein BD289DRAFT_434209 [Coniella lustricola]
MGNMGSGPLQRRDQVTRGKCDQQTTRWTSPKAGAMPAIRHKQRGPYQPGQTSSQHQSEGIQEGNEQEIATRGLCNDAKLVPASAFLETAPAGTGQGSTLAPR